MFVGNLLAIESSCDETACAIIRDDGTVLSDVVHTQDVHAQFGGIVPEHASRRHVGRISSIVDAALQRAELQASQIHAVAVTHAPGLIGSLLVGAMFAKGFAQSLQIPLIPIHHIEGHILAGYGDAGYPEPPFIALIVSGGHTALYLCDAQWKIFLLGETRDDAAGEAFDKIGRLLGFAYPAGPQIDRLAESGDANRFKLPVAMKSPTTLDMSFSGLKTQARLLITGLAERDEQTVSDLCAAVRKAIVDALVAKSLLACKKYEIKALVLGGGVAANSLLRIDMLEKLAVEDILVYLPPKHLCTDNAVMIAKAALRRLQTGEEGRLNFDVLAGAAFELIGGIAS